MLRALMLVACIAAAVLSQPIGESEAQVYNGGVALQTNEEQVAGDGAIRQKRQSQDVNGVALQTDEEQVADDGAIRQKRAGQSVHGEAEQTDEEQVAWADGNEARQGNDGQYVIASDFGGPIVQILQRVFRSGGCCSCGCDCECPEDETTIAPTTATTP